MKTFYGIPIPKLDKLRNKPVKKVKPLNSEIAGASILLLVALLSKDLFYDQYGVLGNILLNAGVIVTAVSGVVLLLVSLFSGYVNKKHSKQVMDKETQFNLMFVALQEEINNTVIPLTAGTTLLEDPLLSPEANITDLLALAGAHHLVYGEPYTREIALEEFERKFTFTHQVTVDENGDGTVKMNILEE